MLHFSLFFVAFCVLWALPAFAIPSPDFLGPVLTWVATMFGFAGAFISTAAFSLRHFFAKRWALPVLFCFSVLTIAGIAIGAVMMYQNSIRDFQNEIAYRLAHPEEVMQPAVRDTQSVERGASSTKQVVPLLNAVATSSIQLPADLISSRVSSSTLLVAPSVLKEVVAEPSWSDRVFVLDIREAEEREIGVVDATTTWIREGDLINGAVAQLPKDRDILVICWTSIRGEEVVRMIRSYGYTRSFAVFGGMQGDEGSNHIGWINSGLPWKGYDRWSALYKNNTYDGVAATKRRMDEGAVIVDVREKKFFEREHLPGAIWFPLQQLSSAQVAQTMSLLEKQPSRKMVVTCEEGRAGYVDCFFARIIGERLKGLGWNYSSPFRDWEEWREKGYALEQ